MWYLKGPSGELIYLKPNVRVTFGRKQCNILLENDASVSRSHASVVVQSNQEWKESEYTSTCTLKDEGSKYGTYVMRNNHVQDVSKEGLVLCHDDRIRFGLQNHIYIVTYVSIITVVSSLKEDDKNHLQNIMGEIDGIITSSWVNKCSHLTVSTATLTEKVVWAMASVIPIVSVDYWTAVSSAIQKKEEMPSPNDFVPQLEETLINKKKVSLLPNKNRKTIFHNKFFVHFSTQQFKTYGKMITLAGGKSLLYSKQPLTEKQLCLGNVVVLQSPSEEATQCSTVSYNLICKELQSKKRRLIPDSEIPLAILFCSIEKYCNPKFNIISFLKRSKQVWDTSEVTIIDTQDDSPNRALPKITSCIRLKSNVNLNLSGSEKSICIPETLDTYDNLDIPANTSKVSVVPELTITTVNVKSKANDTKDSKSNGCIKSSAVPVKYIPETNISFDDTQATQASSCTESSSNHCIKKKVSVNNTEITSDKKSDKRNYIPETLDDFDSQQTTETSTGSEGKKVSAPDKENTSKNTNVITSDDKNYASATSEPQIEEIYTSEINDPVTEITEKSHKKLSQNSNSDSREPSKSISMPLQQSLNTSPGIEMSEITMEEEPAIPRSAIRTEKYNRTNAEDKQESSKENKRTNNAIANTFRFDEQKNRSNKRIHLQNSPPETDDSDDDIEIWPENRTNSPVKHTDRTVSFLRKEPGRKTFKKVYIVTPQSRISMRTMYVWQRETSANIDF